MEYKNEKIISWHVGTGLQLPSPTHHTGDFFAPHYINLRDDCQKKILPSGWPGRAGLRLAPTALQSNVWSGSFKNEYFDDPVSLIFRCTFNPNVVGATAGEPIPAAQRAKNRPAVVVIEGLFSVHFFAQLI
jgi:hypothetical protein